jgi:hypothetical protein
LLAEIKSLERLMKAAASVKRAPGRVKIRLRPRLLVSDPPHS